MDEATLRRLMAFVHPVWMLVSLSGALVTARLGLEIRRRRASGRPVGRGLRERHLRFGRTTLTMIGVGFVLGPLSMFFARERAVFESFHGVLGLIVAGLFAWAGWSGRSLARGDHEARDIHRIAAASAVGAALFSVVAGFALLP